MGVKTGNALRAESFCLAPKSRDLRSFVNLADEEGHFAILSSFCFGRLGRFHRPDAPRSERRCGAAKIEPCRAWSSSHSCPLAAAAAGRTKHRPVFSIKHSALQASPVSGNGNAFVVST